MSRIYFFFNDTATTEIYTLSLHDALPISLPRVVGREARAGAYAQRVGGGAATHHRGAPRDEAAARRLRDGSGGARPVPRNGAPRAVLRRWRVTPHSAARVLPSWPGPAGWQPGGQARCPGAGGA